MEPPFKRPRLSMFRDFESTDTGLETARNRNDHRLKSRFESIFEKYERDFTDLADEIDLNTGQILIDNGHLASMQGEKDVGLSHKPRTRSAGSESSDEQRYNGGKILRAMTVAPPNFDVPQESIEDDDDDVVMLFERIAGNAPDGTDSPDDVIKKERDPSIERDTGIHEPYRSFQDGREDNSLQDSDHDSLLDGSEQLSRSQSADSLLGDVGTRERSRSIDSLMDEDAQTTRSLSQDSLLDAPKAYDFAEIPVQSIEEAIDETALQLHDDEAILDRYGTQVGAQILEVLRQRKAAEEARVEPAWRLPDVGPSFEMLRNTTERYQTPIASSPRSALSSPEDRSMWRPRQTRHRPPKISPPTRRRLSEASAATEDSEDPLQEDFRDPKVDEDAINNWQEYIDNNICPYCKVHKLHLTHHFVVMVRRGRDGIHDLEYLERYCKSRQVGEVTIKLFLDTVQYKELDDMGFHQIAEKIGHPLQLVYNTYYQYRATQKSEAELAEQGRSWTEDEDSLLMDTAKGDNATFRQLRDILKGRKIGEIGNRLATLRMRMFEEQGFQVTRPSRRHKAKPGFAKQFLGLPNERVDVQSDSSEDDFFKAPSVVSLSDHHDSPVDLTLDE